MSTYIVYEVYYKHGDSNVRVFDTTAELVSYLCECLEQTMTEEDYDRYNISPDFSTLPMKTAIRVALDIGRSRREEWRVVHIAEVSRCIYMHQ